MVLVLPSNTKNNLLKKVVIKILQRSESMCEKMTVITFKANDEDISRLDYLAQKYDRTKSDIIRRAIKKVYKEVTGES